MEKMSMTGAPPGPLLWGSRCHHGGPGLGPALLCLGGSWCHGLHTASGGKFKVAASAAHVFLLYVTVLNLSIVYDCPGPSLLCSIGPASPCGPPALPPSCPAPPCRPPPRPALPCPALPCPALLVHCPPCSVHLAYFLHFHCLYCILLCAGEPH